jgi:hypothetical protein
VWYCARVEPRTRVLTVARAAPLSRLADSRNSNGSPLRITLSVGGGLSEGGPLDEAAATWRQVYAFHRQGQKSSDLVSQPMPATLFDSLSEVAAAMFRNERESAERR